MSVEDHITNMLECQQQVIARMALAGWRFVPSVTYVWRPAYYRDGKRTPAGDHALTCYLAYPPGDDVDLHECFEDIYSAACAAEHYMREESAPQDYGFELRDDNAQF